MISIKKIKAKNSKNLKEVIYCLQKFNEDKYKVLHEYLTKHLDCDVVSNLNGILIDYRKNGIIFRYIGDDFGGSYFCSPNYKMESREYYQKLEKILQELIDALNRDNHFLDISE